MTTTLIKDGNASASLYGNTKDTIKRSLSKLGQEFLDKISEKAIVTKDADLQEFSKLIHETAKENPSLWTRLGIKIFASNFRPEINNIDVNTPTFSDKVMSNQGKTCVTTGVVSGAGYLLTSAFVDLGVSNVIAASVAFGIGTGLLGGMLLTGGVVAANETFKATAGIGIAHCVKNMINKMPDEEKEKVRSTVLKLWTGDKEYQAQNQEVFMQKLDEIIPMNEPNKSLAMKP